MLLWGWRRRSTRLLFFTLWQSLFFVSVCSSSFEPYELNGGLVSAVAGKDFCVVATDTRCSGSGYMLHSRNYVSNRLWAADQDDSFSVVTAVEEELRKSEKQDVEVSLPIRSLPISKVPVWIGSSGCGTDCQALQKDIQSDLRAARHFGQITSNRPQQVANLLSQTLYQRRGFPYYSFCVAGGLDPENTCGMVYVYDAIGSFEQVAVAVAGTGKESLQPILDRMFSTSKSHPNQVEGTASSVVTKLCQAYRSVSEREIAVGDKLVLHVAQVADDGNVECKVVVIPLKED